MEVKFPTHKLWEIHSKHGARSLKYKWTSLYHTSFQEVFQIQLSLVWGKLKFHVFGNYRKYFTLQLERKPSTSFINWEQTHPGPAPYIVLISDNKKAYRCSWRKALGSPVDKNSTNIKILYKKFIDYFSKKLPKDHRNYMKIGPWR